MNAIDFVWILSVAQALLPVLDGNRDECRAQTGQLMSGSSSGELLLFPIPAMTAIPLRPFVSFGS